MICSHKHAMNISSIYIYLKICIYIHVYIYIYTIYLYTYKADYTLTPKHKNLYHPTSLQTPTRGCIYRYIYIYTCNINTYICKNIYRYTYNPHTELPVVFCYFYTARFAIVLSILIHTCRNQPRTGPRRFEGSSSCPSCYSIHEQGSQGHGSSGPRL